MATHKECSVVYTDQGTLTCLHPAARTALVCGASGTCFSESPPTVSESPSRLWSPMGQASERARAQ
eukprot:1195913-Prorocentrum_minimum.AAC.11